MIKLQPNRTIRYYYLRFIRLQGSPDVLARGVAVGTFIGITPTIPFHTILALTVSLPLRASKIAALLATIVVSNPLTFFFQYYFSWRIGSWLTGPGLTWEQIRVTIENLTSHAGFLESIHLLGQLGFKTITSLVIGGCLLALPFTVAGYFTAFWFFDTVQKKRLARKTASQ